MACLEKSPFSATVTWLGRVADRAVSLRADPVEALDLAFQGIPGDAHGGGLRASCGRVTMLHPRGTPIRNTRQVSLLSDEELAQIAAAMDLDRLDPGWLGASVVVSGLPDLSHLPPGSRLRAPSQATLAVDLENGPCQYPAQEIERERPGHGRRFVPAARGRRGVTGWVERPGRIARGDRLDLFVPTQRAWQPG